LHLHMHTTHFIIWYYVFYVFHFFLSFFFFFNDTATTEIYTLSLHDALPIWRTVYGLNPMAGVVEGFRWALLGSDTAPGPIIAVRSEEHTSELQSRFDLVCRLLLEKKKKKKKQKT